MYCWLLLIFWNEKLFLLDVWPAGRLCDTIRLKVWKSIWKDGLTGRTGGRTNIKSDQKKAETSFSVNSKHLPHLNVGTTCFKCRKPAGNYFLPDKILFQPLTVPLSMIVISLDLSFCIFFHPGSMENPKGLLVKDHMKICRNICR